MSNWRIKTEEEKAEYLHALFEVEYNLSNHFMGTLCLWTRNRLNIPDRFLYHYYWDYIISCEPNSGFLLQELGEVSSDEFIIVIDNYLNGKYAALIGMLLKQLGKNYSSFCLEKESEEQGIQQLDEMLEKKGYYNLIASRFIFTQLRQGGTGKKVECLSEYKGEIHLDEICFGYVGNYAEYVSRIYHYDFLSELEKKDKCLFSIVIPARNSAYTLRYTLQTVLQQWNIEKSEYEIIISDNSTEGNTEIKELIDEIADSKICYYKTPVDLPLQKSFEFAYGKAGGSYIIPLGADDGMLPWALETLKKILPQYSGENVACWERGFFQWSESNSPQRGKFIIPRNYKKDNYQEVLVNGLETLQKQAAEEGTLIYGIPLYYINTVFKRSYLKEIMDKTGKILDGYTQDINMAIKGMILNENFLYMPYPLTIAGMADRSLGAGMSAEAKSNEELISNLKNETPRGYGYTPLKAELPFFVIASTQGLFWSEFFRDYADDFYREQLNRILQEHDFKRTFLVLTSCRSRKALDYIIVLEKLHYNAWYLDDELGKWYDQVLYPAATQKLYWEEEYNTENGYFTGFSENGGLVLNACQFHVNNIEEAVKLFQKITNL